MKKPFASNPRRLSSMSIRALCSRALPGTKRRSPPMKKPAASNPRTQVSGVTSATCCSLLKGQTKQSKPMREPDSLALERKRRQEPFATVFVGTLNAASKTGLLRSTSQWTGYSPCVVNHDRRIERRESRWSSVNFVGPSFPQTLASVGTVDGHPVAPLAEQPTYMTLRQEACRLVPRLLLPPPPQAPFPARRVAAT